MLRAGRSYDLHAPIGGIHSLLLLISLGCDAVGVAGSLLLCVGLTLLLLGLDDFMTCSWDDGS